MRAHFLWRTGALPFFPGREEKEDFSRGRRWERAEALLGSSARSDLDGFSVIKTRCANVSGPLHVETARSRGTGGVAPERLPLCGNLLSSSSGWRGGSVAGNASAFLPTFLPPCSMAFCSFKHGSDQAQLSVPVIACVQFLLWQSFSRV